jgi:hypothetical protein
MKPDPYKIKASFKYKATHGILTKNSPKNIPSSSSSKGKFSRRRLIDNSWRFKVEEGGEDEKASLSSESILLMEQNTVPSSVYVDNCIRKEVHYPFPLTFRRNFSEIPLNILLDLDDDSLNSFSNCIPQITSPISSSIHNDTSNNNNNFAKKAVKKLTSKELKSDLEDEFENLLLLNDEKKKATQENDWLDDLLG